MDFLLISLFLVLPVLLLWQLNKSTTGLKKAFLFFSLGFILLLGIIEFDAWYGEYNKMVQLKELGYNADGLSQGERFQNIAAENIEMVKAMEEYLLGTGWPIKAFITFLFVAPAYLILLYISDLLYKTIRLQKTRNKFITGH